MTINNNRRKRQIRRLRRFPTGGDVDVISEATREQVDSPESARSFMSTQSVASYERLRKWALFRQPNYWYIFFNGIQVVTCIAVLVFGFTCVEEARDDLGANVAFKLMDKGEAITVNPCGIPAPDMLHLLRLQGVYENQLGMPQLTEPDYNDWNVRVQGSLCATDPYWETIGNDAKRIKENEETDRQRKQYALMSIMGHRFKSSAANLSVDIDVQLLNNMCNTESNRTYSKRLETSFGDPLTRIARAYLAAAPSFRAYQLSSTNTDFTPGTCLGDLDPFAYETLANDTKLSRCGNADYIALVLQRAGSVDNSAGLANGTRTTDTTLVAPASKDPLEQLYALYALSVINHIDKTDNNGACFKNTNAQTAYGLCKDIYPEKIVNDDGSYGGDTFAGFTLPESNDEALTKLGPVEDVSYYRLQDQTISTQYRCSANTVNGHKLATSDPVIQTPAPSSPPFESFRGARSKFAVDLTLLATDHDAVRQHVIGSCAATMQYGLYDQERLFGVPDVLCPFQHDNRPDAPLHFLGGMLADSYYLGPLRDNPLAFKLPAERLELYLAYRLAALTLWGSLVAAVTGYFIGRSGVPLGAAVIAVVLSTKNARGRSSTIVQPAGRSIFQDLFTILAAGTAIATGYYTIWVDPSAQSYYPTTPVCTDYVLGPSSPHSAGGAYVTSWGKRRFNRYSETQIGLVLFVMALVPLVFAFTRPFVQTRTKQKKSKRAGMTIYDTGVGFVFLVCSVALIVGQVGNCINAGNEWVNVAVVSPKDTTNTNDRLSRDCIAMVLISFWAGLSVSVNRASWVLAELTGPGYQVIYLGGCVLTPWLCQLSYMALLPNESANPESVERKTWQGWTDFWLIVYTVAIVVEFWSIQKEKGGGVDASAVQEGEVTDGKKNVEEGTKTGTGLGAGGGDFFKLTTVHVDPRAMMGAAPAPTQTRAAIAATAATAAAVRFARLPLPSEQRRAPMGTLARGEYASMPPLTLRH